MTKTCKKCLISKPFSEFYPKDAKRHLKYENSGAGYSSDCKTCVIVAREKYVAANQEAVRMCDRAYHLSGYGMTGADYNAAFGLQQGCCAGCGRHQAEFKKRLVVDHCHKTGRVRGLLCVACNLCLGYVKDEKSTLERLIKYLSNSELAENNSNVSPLKRDKKVG